MAAVHSNDTDNELPIDLMMLKKGARVLRAFNHPLRQNMLKLLHNNTQMKVGDIYKKLKIDQSVASAHLGILRQARLGRQAHRGHRIIRRSQDAVAAADLLLGANQVRIVATQAGNAVIERLNG